MAGKKIIAGCSSQIEGLTDFLQEAYESGFDIVVFGELAPNVIQGLNIHGRDACGSIALMEPGKICNHFTSCTKDDAVAVIVSFNPHGDREMQDYMSQLLDVTRKSVGEIHLFLAEIRDFADFIHAYEAGDILLMGKVKQRTNPKLNELLKMYPRTLCD